MSVVLVSLLLLVFLIISWRNSPETASIVGSTPSITDITSDLANNTYSQYCAGSCTVGPDQSVNHPADWDGIIPIKVVFDSSVTVDGLVPPALGLKATGVDDAGLATYDSGSGSDTLVFHYAITDNKTYTDLNVRSIVLGSSTISNTAGNADLAIPDGHNLADNKDINIDSKPPSALTVYISRAGDNNPLTVANKLIGENPNGSGNTVWLGNKRYWFIVPSSYRWQTWVLKRVSDGSITACDAASFSGVGNANHQNVNHHSAGLYGGSDTYNGQKMCGSVADDYGNRVFATAYIRGIDRTNPQINIKGLTVENKVAATAEDPNCGPRTDGHYIRCSGINADQFYALPIDEATTCNANAYDSITLADYSYTADTLVDVAVGKKICFRVHDYSKSRHTDTFGRVAYAASGGRVTGAPVITQITSDHPNKTYSPRCAGQCSHDQTPTEGWDGNLKLKVVFNQVVTVTGTPTLSLSLSDQSASYESGTGSDTLIFNYPIAQNQLSADLDVSSITLPAGTTIKDSADNNNAGLTIPDGSNLADTKNIGIDSTAPSFEYRIVHCLRGNNNDDCDSGNTIDEAWDGSGTTKYYRAKKYWALIPSADQGNIRYGLVATVASGDTCDQMTFFSDGYATLVDSDSVRLQDNPNTKFGRFFTETEVAYLCLAGADKYGNYTYSDLAQMRGIDREPPEISFGPIDGDNMITATVFDTTSGIRKIEYVRIGSSTCGNNSFIGITVDPYISGDAIPLAAEGRRVCMRAYDNTADTGQADSGQVTYKLSQPRPAALAIGEIISTTADGAYNTDTTITIVVGFSRALSIDLTNGNPSLSLNSANDAEASYSSSLGNSLLFTYTPVDGHNVADLDVTAFNLNGALITAEGTVPSSFDIPAGNSLADNQNLLIDTTPPAIVVRVVAETSASADASDNLTPPGDITLSSIVLDSGTCDASASGTFVAYDPDDSLTITSSQTPCFKAVDLAGNVRYADPVSGVDTFPPVINVTPQTDDSSPKREIVVSASTLAEDLDANPAWTHQIIDSGTDCDADALTNPETGDSVTLNAEAHNGKKVCFSVSDTTNNPGYQASGIITGIDRTPPTITISTDDDSSFKLSHSIFASATGDLVAHTWRYKLIDGEATCNAAALENDAISSVAVVFLEEADNGKKACLSVADSLGNLAYGASGIITGIDRSPPVISVTFPDYAAREIVVSAAADDASGLRANSWRSKLIDGGTECNDGALSGASSSNSVTVNSEADNGKKVCFGVEDILNWDAYVPSPVITKIDRTDPVISVGSVTNNKVSATVTETNLATFKVQKITGTCSASTTGTFDSYSAGDSVSLAVGEKACFEAKDTAGNSHYAASTVGVAVPVITTTINYTTEIITAVDDEAGTTTIKYVVLDSDSCDASTDFSSASTYDESGSGQSFSRDHDNKYVCFRSTNSANNHGYHSALIDYWPIITSIMTLRDSNFYVNEEITIVISFSEDITYSGGSRDISFSLNSERGGRNVPRVDANSDNQLVLTHKTAPGDYTPGQETPTDTSDDLALKLSSLAYAQDAQSNILVDASSQAAVLSLSDEVNISATQTKYVDALVTTVTVTNPTDLDSLTETKVLSAVDDYDSNTRLSDNDEISFGGLSYYAFEYYFVPASEVSASDLQGALGQRPADAACGLNINYHATNSYVEGQGLPVTIDQDDHYVCFRSRRAGHRNYIGGFDNKGYSGVMSQLLTNFKPPAPIITIEAGSAAQSFKAIDNDDDTTTWRSIFIEASDDCDGSLDYDSDDSTAADYTEGNDVDYSSQNGKKLCFRSSDSSDNHGYGASGVIDAVAPTITEIDDNQNDGSYKQGARVDIVVTLSEVFQTTGNNSDITVTLNSGGSASYLQKTSTEILFTYTVGASENAANLNATAVVLANSATITDLAGNPLDLSLPASNNLADNSDIVIDTTPPVITVNEVSPAGTVSATVTDILDSSPTIEAVAITGTCDSSVTGFVAYNPDSGTVSLSVGQKACFKATDLAENTVYLGSDTRADTTAPTITVTPADAHSAAKTEIEVSASSDDTDLGSNPAWSHQVINDGVACDADALTSASTGSSVTLSTEADNNKRVCFSVSDTNNNPGYGRSGLITGIDTTPPTITVTPSSDDSTAKQEITVSATVSDSGSGIKDTKYKLIGGDDTCDETEMNSGTTSGSSLTLSSESDNGKKVCFYVEDGVGHRVHAGSGVITGIDTTRPTIGMIRADPGAFKAGDVISILVTISEAYQITGSNSDLSLSLNSGGTADFHSLITWMSPVVIMFQYTVAAGENTASLNATALVLSNGVTITDMAGNPLDTSLPANNNIADYLATTDKVIMIDTALPAINVGSVSSGGVVTATVSDILDSSPTIEARSIDGADICDSSITTGFTAYTPGTSSVSLSVGQKACFKAEDAAGNVAYAASTVRLDTTAPIISVTPASADSAAKTEIEVTAISTDTDLGSNPAWTHQVINDGVTCNAAALTSTSSGNSVTLNTEADNDKKVCFSVSDTNNNPGYGLSGLITGIDRTPPTITVTPSSDDSSAKQSITVSATVSDSGSGIKETKYQVIAGGDTCNEAALSAPTTGSSITLSSETNNGQKVCFSVEDNVAHIAYADSGTISGIDTTDPTIRVTPSSDDSSAKQEITITALATDDGSGLKSGSWRYKIIDDGDSCDEAQMTISTTGNGHVVEFDHQNKNDKKVCFRVEDNAGNRAYGESGTISGIDTTKPVISVSAVTAGKVSATASDNSGTVQTFQSTVFTTGNCDSSSTATFTDYTGGDDVSLAEGETACFKASDGAGNSHYAASTTGTDITPPTIDVTPAGDNSAPKQEITLTASTLASDLPATPAWLYKLIAHDATCNEAQMTSDTTSGNSFTFNLETHNNHKVCFAVTDRNANTGYGASGIITGIDKTAPTITVTLSSDASGPKRHITVSATASDSDVVSGSWNYKVILGTDICTNNNWINGSSAALNSESQNNHKVCFIVRDTAGNWASAESGTISGIDRTAPTITAISGDNIDGSHKQGAELTIIVTISETASVFTSFNHYISLTLNSGGSASYIRAERDNNQLIFSYTVGSNQNTSDLNVTALNLLDVGSSIQDLPGNALDRTLPVGNNLADNAQAVIDTTPPTITVSPLSGGNVSATVTDNLSAPADISFQSALLTSGSCDASSGATFADYTAATDVAVAVGETACFKATDGADNTRYAASATGTDSTPPTITVNPANADSSPKQEITVTASSGASDLPATPLWQHQVIDGETACDEDALSSPSNGASVTLSSEADNGKKVCFGLTDRNANTGYQASGVITGIDRTPPTINPFRDLANQVSATVSDNLDAAPSLSYQLLSDAICDVNTADSFTPYTGALTVIQGQKVCFKATDTAGNVAFTASLKGRDITAPQLSVTTSVNIVSAVDDEDNTSIIWKLVEVGDCSAAEMASGTTGYGTEGADLPAFSDPADNGKVVCFSSADVANNRSYAASEPLIITATLTIVVGGVVNNSLSASDNYPGPTTMSYIFGANDSCDSSLSGSFTAYSEAAPITLAESHNGSYVCFKSVDGADATNLAYQVSGLISGVDLTAPLVSVTAGSQVNSYQASDDEGGLSSWVYKFIGSDQACDSSIDFSDGSSYTEAQAVSYSSANNGRKLCFRSSDALANHGYGDSAVINVIEGPIITSISAQAGSYRAGEVITIRLDFSASLTVSGTPRLQLNFGADKYALMSPVAQPTEYLEFRYTVVDGDNLDLLEVVAFETNGATLLDTNHRALNPDVPAQALSQVATIRLDTAPPVIIISPILNNSLSAIDQSQDDLTWHYQILEAQDEQGLPIVCDSQSLVNPIAYRGGDRLGLRVEDNGSQICFRATDEAGNQSYQALAINGVSSQPPPDESVQDLPDQPQPPADEVITPVDDLQVGSDQATASQLPDTGSNNPVVIIGLVIVVVAGVLGLAHRQKS